MKNLTFLPLLVLMTGCGASASSYVKSDDTTLGRVVVYRNGVAYFERTAEVQGDHLDLKVPADKVDDFLKSLTVVDAQTGKPAPVSYPTQDANRGPGATGLIDMRIGLSTPTTHRLKLSYVTEAPSWKSSYRVVLGTTGKVDLEGWAIVDNTSGEDWNKVRLGVGSSSALSFRFDLQSVRLVERETLHSNDLFASAPPTGGSTYGGEKKLVAELDDSTLSAHGAASDESDGSPYGYDFADNRAAPEASPMAAGAAAAAPPAKSAGRGHTGPSDKPKQASPASPATKDDAIVQLARRVKAEQNAITVEGFANAGDADKEQMSFDRANRLRDQLIRQGVDPNKVVAVGRGEQAGHAGGARILEGPESALAVNGLGSSVAAGKSVDPAAATSTSVAPEPIGTSNFESGSVTSVARGSSAMVSILHESTEGGVVYLYDPDGVRGNAQFPFKSVRLKNPSDSVLETGPVTVFGDGRFIGEGMAEPIPAHSMAFVPFALDRQIVVERTSEGKDEISRLMTVQRGVFSAEVQHKKKFVYALSNRLDSPATVYVRHTVAPGFQLSKAPEGAGEEKLGTANLFRVVVPAHGKMDIAIEEATPLTRSIDVRSGDGIEEVRAYLSTTAVDPALKDRVAALLDLNKQMADVESHIVTLREQMGEYRERMDELHNQIFTLKAVKTAGPLMQSLEKKMSDISDRLSKATLDVVAAQEKLMVAKVHFQDGVADLSLDKPDVPANGSPAKTPPSKTASAI